jgi:hypothetical protein
MLTGPPPKIHGTRDILPHDGPLFYVVAREQFDQDGEDGG